MRRKQRPVSGLMVAGLSELALGALTGWPCALAIANPERAKKAGIRSTARLGWRSWLRDR